MKATLREAQQRATEPCIVSVQRDAFDGDSEHVNNAAKTWPSGTLKGKWPQPGGPVLAWVPDMRVLQRAMRTARGSALIVVQWPDRRDDWWAEWAQLVGATDLSTGVKAIDSRSPQLKEDIDYVLWNGNNGWPPRDSITRGTVRYLTEVAARGDLHEPAFVAAAIAADKSESAIKRLRDMMSEARRPLPQAVSRPTTADRW